jgi:hypothetical protein
MRNKSAVQQTVSKPQLSQLQTRVDIPRPFLLALFLLATPLSDERVPGFLLMDKWDKYGCCRFCTHSRATEGR